MSVRGLIQVLVLGAGLSLLVAPTAASSAQERGRGRTEGDQRRAQERVQERAQQNARRRAAAQAERARSQQGGPQQQEDEHLRTMRERWSRLTPEDKQRLRHRFERYSNLDPAERAQLSKRSRRIEEVSRSLERQMPEGVREQIEGLNPRERRAVMHDLVEAEVRERSQRIRRSMPEPLKARLEGLPPEERERELEKYKRVQCERIGRHVIFKLGKRLGISTGELRRMSELPVEARLQAMLELQRQVALLDAKDHGLPPGMTPEKWAELEQLPPEEFFQAFVRHGESRWTASERTSRAEQDPARGELQRRLKSAMRLDPEALMELSHLERDERRRQRARLVRERCSTVLAEGNLLEPAELQRVKGLSDREFLDWMRAFFEGESGMRRRGPAAGRGWPGRHDASGERRRPPRERR